ncbi:hypothetical protein ACFX13_009115 [Malus domestica]
MWWGAGAIGAHDETKQKNLDILKRFHSEEETNDMDDDDAAGILYVHCEIYEKFVIDGFLELCMRSLLLMNS